MVLLMDSRDKDVLVGDVSRSMSLLKNSVEGDPATIERVAGDSAPIWMCAVKIINENLFIGADDNHNLFTMKRERNQDDVDKLEIVAGYHLGQQVNRFRDGKYLFSLSIDTPLTNKVNYFI
jgi:DNA damage-binding protein 1